MSSLKRAARTGRPASSKRIPRAESALSSTATSPGVRSRMQQQRTRDTGPELALRHLLHAAGLRYRVDRPPLPGMRRRADLVFGPARVAVYVDGCFWHGCPEHGNAPRANSDYWRAKLETNRRRDLDTDVRLAEAGWQVLRVWEHEDAPMAAERVRSAVLKRRHRPASDRRLA